MSFKSVSLSVGLAIVLIPTLSAGQSLQSHTAGPVAKAIGASVGTIDWRSDSEFQESLAKQQKMKSGLYKMIAGGTLATVGAILAATSGANVESCFNDPFFGRQCVTVDARSDGQLWSGIGMAGAGGVLLWLGAVDRANAVTPGWHAGVLTTHRDLSLVLTRRW